MSHTIQNASSYASNSTSAYEGGFTSPHLAPDAVLTLSPLTPSVRTNVSMTQNTTDWSERCDSHGRTIKVRLIIDGQGQNWTEILGTDGYVHQERELPSRDAGPNWVETDFRDEFGREISRVIPCVDGENPWTETYNAQDGVIARFRFGRDGCYYRETLRGRTVQRIRSWNVGTTQLSEDVSGREIPGRPQLCLTASVAPV